MVEKTVIEIDPSVALKKRYTLRVAGQAGTSIQTTVPREVVERAAEQVGMSTEVFIENHECEWLYNSFDGILLRFMPKRKSTLL